MLVCFEGTLFGIGRERPIDAASWELEDFFKLVEGYSGDFGRECMQPSSGPRASSFFASS